MKIFLNRDIRYANENGTLNEAINMKDKEKELKKWYEDDKQA